MKKGISIIILSLFSSFVYSQGYMDAIARKACECIEKLSRADSSDHYVMQAGVCIIDAAIPYKKKLKKDHNIDVYSGLDSEKLGTIVGYRMASICPNTLITLSGFTEDEPAYDQDEHPRVLEMARGTITKIEEDFFIRFSLKDENGKVSKYYWFTFIESDMDLINDYKTLLGKNVTMYFDSMEFYDPIIQEYRLFYILKRIERPYN